MFSGKRAGPSTRDQSPAQGCVAAGEHHLVATRFDQAGGHGQQHDLLRTAGAQAFGHGFVERHDHDAGFGMQINVGPAELHRRIVETQFDLEAPRASPTSAASKSELMR